MASQEITKAFVVGGLGEFTESLEPLAHELDSGEHRIVDEAEPITMAYAFENPAAFIKEARRRIVIARSYGVMAVDEAGVMMSLCGVEPITMRRAVKGAKQIQSAFSGYMGHESHVEDRGELFIPELIKHPRATARAVRGIFRDSSLAKLVRGGLEAYPGGRYYVAMDKDEYGFGGNGEVELANIFGIKGVMLPGHHNTSTAYPKETAKNISEVINQ